MSPQMPLRTCLLLLLTGCADLTTPPAAMLGAASAQPGAAAPAPRPTAAPTAGGAAAVPERIKASHVLIAYKGATRARPETTRSKEEAAKLAAQIAERARKGEDFGSLALQHSDDPSAKARKGSLGSFGRESMVKPFADAAFALKPGDISQVVETNFGFHVIRRDE